MADTVQISRQVLKRMPYYLQQLKQLQREGAACVAATGSGGWPLSCG